MIITSRENKIFKLVKLLKTAKGRSEKNLFLIEGMRSVRDAIEKNAVIDSILLSDGTELDFKIDCAVYTFAPKLFREICETVSPQGVLALCRTERKNFGDIIASGKKCVILCENLQDPGNIGTIIRTAHAADCGGVVLSKGCCDLYNPKIVRATMTGIFSVPTVTSVNCSETIKLFKSNGYRVVAGALSDDAIDFYGADLNGKTLIIVGNEGNGVTEETLGLCDSVLKIPMRADAESLNASVAGAVMIYEHYRQNRENS